MYRLTNQSKQAPQSLFLPIHKFSPLTIINFSQYFHDMIQKGKFTQFYSTSKATSMICMLIPQKPPIIHFHQYYYGDELFTTIASRILYFETKTTFRHFTGKIRSAHSCLLFINKLIDFVD